MRNTDRNLDEMILRIEITNLEASTLYAALMSLRHCDPEAHDALIEKFKLAQAKAINELIDAELVKGRPQ